MAKTLRCLCFALKVKLHINWWNLSFSVKPPSPRQTTRNFCKLVFKLQIVIRNLKKLKLKQIGDISYFGLFGKFDTTSILGRERVKGVSQFLVKSNKILYLKPCWLVLEWFHLYYFAYIFIKLKKCCHVSHFFLL